MRFVLDIKQFKDIIMLFNGAFWTNILRLCIMLGLIGLALIPYGIFFYLVNM